MCRAPPIGSPSPPPRRCAPDSKRCSRLPIAQVTPMPAATAYDDLIATLDHADAPAAAEHLRVARPEAMSVPHPPSRRPASLRRQGPTRARYRRARARHARNEPPHRRRGALVHPRSAGHPHGQARPQIPSRPVGSNTGARHPTSSAVHPRGLRPMSTLGLATQIDIWCRRIYPTVFYL